MPLIPQSRVRSTRDPTRRSADAVIAPVLAAVGALAAVLTECTVEGLRCLSAIDVHAVWTACRILLGVRRAA